jgi:hypothetical protein
MSRKYKTVDGVCNALIRHYKKHTKKNPTWVQESYGNLDEGTGQTCCLSAGISHFAEEYSETWHEVRKRLRQAIGEIYIPEWNDRKGRTVGQVIKALEKTKKVRLSHEEV